ncbi:MULTISPECIES: hypothetical protein [Arthrobacter]|uniref:hypothetical protein n=1 Tax=unclassified Arthrobacter TaxID=235627 RepID=UPI0031BB8A8D
MVDRIVTGQAVLDITDNGLALVETAPGVNIESIRAATGAHFSVSEDLLESSAN